MSITRPALLSPATPAELLSYIICSHKYPATLVVGYPMHEFLAALSRDVALRSSRPVDEHGDPLDPDAPEVIPHALTRAPLFQTAVSRHIRVVFTPTITHFRAYISVFSASASTIPPPPSHISKTQAPPALLIYGFLDLHRDASEWSAQGIGNSVAVLVHAAAREGFRPTVVEPVGAGNHETLDSLVNEALPLIKGSTRRDDGSWSGRTVTIKQTMSRWFDFDAREWTSNT